MNKVVVAYYMKGEAKQYRVFSTREEAKAFCRALAQNPNCECYGIE